MAIPFLLALLSVPEKGSLDESIRRLVERIRPFDGTILVAQKGKRLYEKSFGLADRALGVKMRNETRFRIASITKAFTSALVLKLVEEGKLDLEKPIRTYLPAFPGEGGDRITLRQLLNHTSGLPNPDAAIKGYEQAKKDGLDHYQRLLTSDELVARFCRGPLRSEPGAAFDYNNADYVVLGRIVEAVLGTSFEEALRQRILTPLGMRDTGLFTRRRLVKDLASTYFLPPGAMEFENEIPVYIENWYAAGAMYSTADDLLRFFDALFQGRLLRPATREAMLKPGLDDYGFGVWVYAVEIGGKRLTAVKRPGLIMGANVELLHLREIGLTVIVLSNTNHPDVGELARKIAQLAAPPSP